MMDIRTKGAGMCWQLGSWRGVPRNRLPALRLGILLLAAPLAFAATVGAAEAAAKTDGRVFTVAPNGSDTNPGTEKEPWKTIQKAADTLEPGDTVVIRKDVYRETVTPKRSGTKEARITYRSYGNREHHLYRERVAVDGEGIDVGKWGALLTINGKSFLTFDGLEIRNSGANCISVSDEEEESPAIGLIFDHLDVHDAKGGSGFAFNNKVQKPAYTYIRDCAVHHNERAGIGLFLDAGGYYIIERNRLFYNRGKDNYDVIQVGIGDPNHDSNHIVIRHNMIYYNGMADPGSDPIDMGGHGGEKDYSGHVLVEQNLIFGQNGAVKIGGRKGLCIVRHNVMYEGGFINMYKQPYPYSSIYNNTVVSTFHGILVGQDDKLPPTSFGGLQLRNNLFAKQQCYMICAWTRVIDLKAPDSLFADGDLFAFLPERSDKEKELGGWQSKYGQDPHATFTTVPLEEIFEDVARLDFHLVPGSPAIDSGVPLTTAKAAGEGAEVTVGTACFFHDGYDGLVEPDKVRIGSNPPVRIKHIDYEKGVLVLAAPIRWNQGDPVNLPYAGKAPDCGAYEFGPLDAVSPADAGTR